MIARGDTHASSCAAGRSRRQPITALRHRPGSRSAVPRRLSTGRGQLSRAGAEAG